MNFDDELQDPRTIGSLIGVAAYVRPSASAAGGASLWVSSSHDPKSSARRTVDWETDDDVRQFFREQRFTPVCLSEPKSTPQWWTFRGFVFRAESRFEPQNVKRLVNDVVGPADDEPEGPWPSAEVPADPVIAHPLASRDDLEDADPDFIDGVFDYAFPAPRSFGPLTGLLPVLEERLDGVEITALDENGVDVLRMVPWASEAETYDFMLRQWTFPREVDSAERLWMFRSHLFEASRAMTPAEVGKLYLDDLAATNESIASVSASPGLHGDTGGAGRPGQRAAPRHANTGEYRERLPEGGALVVSAEEWRIDYYWPGPDLRHKGTLFTISGNRVGTSIEALRSNWSTFVQLQETVPDGGNFTAPGEGGMTIYVGGPFSGVCLHGHHGLMGTKAAIENRIEAYASALLRAPALQHLIFRQNTESSTRPSP